MAKARKSSALPLGDQPWYVKAVVWVGAPTVAAGYLLYFVLHILTAKLDTMNAAMTQQQTSMNGLVSALQAQAAHEQSALEQSFAQLSVTIRVCLNTAKTDADRIACASIAPRQP